MYLYLCCLLYLLHSNFYAKKNYYICICHQNGAGENAASKPAKAAKTSKTKAAVSSLSQVLSVTVFGVWIECCHLSYLYF